MIQETIDKAFNQMIARPRVHKTLGITASHVKTLRHQIRTNQRVSTEKKLKLLARSGWDPGLATWSDMDMLAVVQHVLKAGPDAKSLGAHYLFDQFKARHR